MTSTRSANLISKLNINEEAVDDMQRIKNHIVEFFKELYRDLGIV